MAVPDETRLLVVELDRLMLAAGACICSNMASLPATPPLGFFLCGSDLGVVIPDDDALFSSARIQASRLAVGAAVGGRVLGVRRGIEPAAAPWAGATTGPAAGCHDRRRTSTVEDGARVLGVDVGVGMDAFLGVGRGVLVSGMGSRFTQGGGGCITGIEKRFVPSLLPPPPAPPPVTRRPVVLGPTDRNKLVSRTECCRWEEDSSGVEEVGGPAGTSLLHDMTVRRRDWVEEVASGVATASTTVEWRSEMRIGWRSGATDASGIDSRRLMVLGLLLGATPAAGAVVDDKGATDQVSGTTARGAGAGTGFRATVSSMLASWSVLMEKRSAIGVVLYRCAGSGFRRFGPFRRGGDGGSSTFGSSNHPSASRNDSTRVRSTSRIGATVGTPSWPVAVAVALSFLVDPRRTKLDSFSRTLGSCMLLKLVALSQMDVISKCERDGGENREIGLLCRGERVAG